MLSRLVIKDVVLIDTLELAFGDGLTVFTGETGAGKSILLDALGLALGMRGDPSLIRPGCSQAIVIAEFLTQDDRLKEDLRAAGIPDHETLVLRRVLNRTGPSRAYINDQLVTLGLLKDISPYLLEIHGQFDRLLTPISHRKVLDELGQIETKSISFVYAQWKALKEQYEASLATNDRMKVNLAFLQNQVDEIEALKPQPHEESYLLDLRQKLMQQDRIHEGLTQSIQALAGHSGVLTNLHACEKTLTRLQDLLPDKGKQALAALNRGIVEITEAQASLEEQRRDLLAEPWDLAAIDDRLQALRAIARKYGTTPECLGDQLHEAQQQLSLLSSFDEDIAKLQEAKEKTWLAYGEAAKVLHNQRMSAKEILVNRVNQELPALKLEKAQFQVVITELPLEKGTEEGIDSVEFFVTTNPDHPLGPLSKVASGGELSRLMLAMRVALAQQNHPCTLIFDEIDQGTGGAVASAIGERLMRLAEGSQVFVITHSPQIAACASHHILVSKIQEGERLATRAETLSLEEKHEELARMLSGQEITHEARAAAGQLLKRTGS